MEVAFSVVLASLAAISTIVIAYSTFVAATLEKRLRTSLEAELKSKAESVDARVAGRLAVVDTLVECMATVYDSGGDLKQSAYLLSHVSHLVSEDPSRALRMMKGDADMVYPLAVCLKSHTVLKSEEAAHEWAEWGREFAARVTARGPVEDT